jgi:tRNA A-37 threonylcarbamoyl transferase component Bud32
MPSLCDTSEFDIQTVSKFSPMDRHKQTLNFLSNNKHWIAAPLKTTTSSLCNIPMYLKKEFLKKEYDLRKNVIEDIYEYGGTDLKTYIDDMLKKNHQNKKQYIIINNILRDLTNVLEGIVELHKLGFCHNDIHFKNIVCTKMKNSTLMRLIDFGECKKSNDHCIKRDFKFFSDIVSNITGFKFKNKNLDNFITQLQQFKQIDNIVNAYVSCLS